MVAEVQHRPIPIALKLWEQTRTDGGQIDPKLWKNARLDEGRTDSKPASQDAAANAGRLYLDLADEHWRAVAIGPDGWRVLGSPPVRFRRALGMLPLPVPERGGSIEALPSEDSSIKAPQGAGRSQCGGFFGEGPRQHELFHNRRRKTF